MKLSFKYRTAVWLIDILSATWRIRTEGAVPNKPSVIAFWHGFMLPVWRFFGKKGSTAAVSLSKDGEILSALLKKWGFDLVRGSSSEKGKELLERLYAPARSGCLLITPDGPRGPVYKFKAGAVVTAQRAGRPIYLCGVKINRRRRFLKSWDRFSLPAPFAKITLIFSEGIIIPENSSHEEINSYIWNCEKQLNQLHDKEDL